MRRRRKKTYRYAWIGKRHTHRVVAEEVLGRPLKPGEVVHHVNGDVRDNRPGNLKVFASQREHALHHETLRAERKCEVEGCGRKHYGNGFCSLHYQRWWKAEKEGR